MHLADSVWTATERHLFRDARGKRHGMPRVGRWFDFTRLPGPRPLAHQRRSKWETFRLHGTLAGHRAAYTDRRRRLRPAAPPAPGRRATRGGATTGRSRSCSPAWPTARSSCRCGCRPRRRNQPILDHHLADPSRWHKIDLVRQRDPNAAGRLALRGAPDGADHAVRVAGGGGAPRDGRRSRRWIARAGIDVNVSNVTVASHDAAARDARDAASSAMRPQQQRDRRRARRERRRQREIDRSRRAMNRAQYQLSKRQEKRARRRDAAGLSPVEVIPMGPRNARADGVPLQSYRRDQLSTSYRRGARGPGRRRRRRGAGAPRSCAAGRRRRSSPRTATSSSSRTAASRAWSRSWGRARRGVLAGHADRCDRSRGARGRRGRRWRSVASSARRRGRPRSRSTARAARGSPSASPIASMAARRAGCAAIATPSPPCSRRSSCSHSPASRAPRATPYRRPRRTLPSPQRHRHRLPRHRPDPALQHQIPPMTAHQLLSYVRSPGDRAGSHACATSSPTCTPVRAAVARWAASCCHSVDASWRCDWRDG